MDKRVEQVYDLIKRRHRDKLTLEVIAKHVELSPFHLHRLFKRETGVTPLEHLTRIRLERAAHLIRSGLHTSLSDVASDCGFSSLSAFSRAFSNWYGVSPQEFQKGKSTLRITIYQPPELDVKIVYLPEVQLLYNVTGTANTKLPEEFDSVRALCDVNRIETGPRNMGIGTHVTFHYPYDPRNYYAGVEVTGTVPAKYGSRLFRVEKGKFACFESKQPINEVQENMLWFMKHWLENSRYIHRELIWLDEFIGPLKAEDYPRFHRRIWVPVKSRS